MVVLKNARFRRASDCEKRFLHYVQYIQEHRGCIQKTWIPVEPVTHETFAQSFPLKPHFSQMENKKNGTFDPVLRQLGNDLF